MCDNSKIVHCFECKHAHMTGDGECKYCDFWQPDGGDALYLDGNFFCAGAVLSEEARINREAAKQIDYRNRFGSGLGLY